MSFLVEMDVAGGDTYYWSDIDIVVSGIYYADRLVSPPAIEADIGPADAPRQHDPRATLVFDDTDQWPERMDTIFRNNDGLAAATFRLYSGSGFDKDEYALIFTGRVDKPGGVAFQENFCQIELVKELQRQNRGLPSVLFVDDAAARAGVPQAFDQYYIPRVFGDFTAAPKQYIPCLKLAAATFYLCHPDDIQAINGVKDGDGNVYATGTGYTRNGAIITLSSADPDKLFVSVNGATDSSYGQRAAGLARWLILNLIGASDLDTTAFTTLDNTNQFPARIYYGEQDVESQPQAIDELTKLLGDLFHDLILTPDGEFKPVARSHTAITALRNIYRHDLRPTGGGIDYQAGYDPNKVLANRLFLKYALDPETGQFAETHNQSDLQGIQRLGFTRTQNINCKFFYTSLPVGNLADLWLHVFGRDFLNFEFPLDEIADLQPGDLLRVNIDQFVDEPIQVRGVRWHLGEQYTDIEGVSITALQVRTFAPDAVADYATASANEKAEYAYFTDDDGDHSGSQYAPGGHYTLAYMEIANVTTDDAVRASLFNQVIENIKNVRETKFTVPYGSGSDYLGVALVVDSSGIPVWACKANTAPESITAANASRLIHWGETSPSPSDLPP